MVLGYDEARPTEENYKRFLERLSEGLREICPQPTLMIYGSYVRGDYNPGRNF